ncbi:MAG: extracellular solute-binding protein [Ruminococcus sp.]|nr:extracellular solute-binding protein [Ruminococcus sp.]
MKRLTASAAAAALLLTACSSGNTVSVTDSSTVQAEENGSEAAKPMKAAQTQYKESRIPLPDDFSGMLLLYNCGGVRFLYQDRDGGMAIQLYDDDMTPTETLKLEVPEDSRSKYTTEHTPCSLPDGGIAMLDMYAVYDGDIADSERWQRETEPEFVLRIYSSDGRLVSESEVGNDFYTFGDDYIQSLSVYGDNYILSMRDSYLLLSPEGKVLESTNTDENWYFCTDTEGRTLAAGRDGWGYMDGSTLKLPQSPAPYGKWLNPLGVPFTGCGEYKAFITLNEGFYGVDSEDRLTELMDFTDSDFVPQFVYMAASAGEKRFVLITNEQTSSSGLSYVLMTQRPEDYTEADKKTVRIGCINGDHNAGDTVVMFNKQSENYKAETKRYKEYDDLKYDILTGDAPDLFCYQPSSVMYRFARAGAFTDLYELLDSREGLSRDDIMPNVMKAYEYKGGLYGLPVAYSLNCWIANREVIPREYSNWDLDEFFSFAENMPEGMYLGSKNSPFMSPEQTFDTLLPTAMSSFVDFDGFTCDFGSPEFLHLLTFCRDAKIQEGYDWKNMSDSEKTDATAEYRYSILNKESLLNWCFLRDPNDYIVYPVNDNLYLNDRFTYAIFPNKERSGTISTVNNMCYSILNGCAEPEGAWEYFCFINSEDYLTSYLQTDRAFYSNRHLTETKMEEAFDWADGLDFTGYGYYDPSANGGSAEEDTEEQKYVLPDETKRYLRDFFSTFMKLQDQDEVIYGIAEEEAGKFFAGETSAEDCAAMIQNRVSLYLSENS